MKNRINLSLILVGIMAVLLTAGTAIFIFYQFTAGNIVWSILFKKISIPLLAIMVGVIGMSYWLSTKLTNSIVDSVEQVANKMDHIEDVLAYEELLPVIKTIQKQHEDIINMVNIRQEFTANVSHELKTPLTAISGYAELIQSGMTQPEDAKRFSGEIVRNSTRLLVLINDIIRLSELDVTEEEITFTPVELKEVAQNCVELLEPLAKKNNVSIVADGDTAWVASDRAMLEEIVYNLCDNAIRYNRPGGQVFVETYQSDGKVVLTVRDNGIGISKENQKRIFERFYRVDKSRSKDSGGTGLGLAIVKHLAKRCGTEIQLESEEGLGTVMRLVFPVENKITSGS